MGPNAVLHIHHYFIGMISGIFLCYQNTFIVVVHALLTGVMVEGGCKWGYGGIWSVRQPTNPVTENTQKVLTTIAQSNVRHANYTQHALQNVLQTPLPIH